MQNGRPPKYGPNGDVFIEAREAGKILEVSQPTLRKMVSDGTLPRNGKKYRLSAINRLKSNPEGIL